MFKYFYGVFIKKRFRKSLLFLLFLLFVLSTFFVNETFTTDISEAALSSENMDTGSNTTIDDINIPFVKNRGQSSNNILFYSNTFGGTVHITTSGEIVYSYLHENRNETSEFILKETLVGGKIAKIKGESKSSLKVNYFTGNKKKWRNKVPAYKFVNLGEVYKNISVKIKAYGNKIEKLFYIKPGGKPKKISLRLKGMDKVAVDKNGVLSAYKKGDKIEFSKPVAYQLTNGKKEFIKVAYEINGNSYGFKLGSYDNKKELIIDPLISSTYFGSLSKEKIFSITSSEDQNIYVAGWAFHRIPEEGSGAFIDPNDSYDIFIAKVDRFFRKITAFTYLGGDLEDQVTSITTNKNTGDLFITGWTASKDFPITNDAYKTTFSGNSEGDAFVSVFNSNLDTLLASTYIGGNMWDKASSISVDSNDNVYIAGKTESIDFPRTDQFGEEHSGVDNDMFISKFDKSLQTLTASILIGSTINEVANFVKVDISGNVYVGGTSLILLDPELKLINSINFFGELSGITFDNDYIYVVGNSWRDEFPKTILPQGYDKNHNGGTDAFIAKYDKSLDKLSGFTYLGGEKNDTANAISMDSQGNVFVAGSTDSLDFPVTNLTYDADYNGGEKDGFVAKFDSELKSLEGSTFLGGDSLDEISSMYINDSGNVYVAGWTSSLLFPVSITAFGQEYNGGDSDAFISIFDNDLAENRVPGESSGNSEESMDDKNKVECFLETINSIF